MRTLFPSIGLRTISGLFGLSRQAVYQNQKAGYIRLVNEQYIIEQIKQIRKIHPRIGTRKLYYLVKPKLNSMGIKYGRDKLFNLLKTNNLLIRKRKRKIITTQSNHPFKRYKNLIEFFEPIQADQLWVSDITYFKTKEENCYLFLLTDAYSRKICGYKLSNNLESSNAIACLKMAIKQAKNTDSLIHHSDRGIQYCSNKYVKLLQDYNVKISMTQDGNPLDNSVAERVNGILKQEYLNIKNHQNLKELENEVERTILKYNNLRPHLSCDLMTPINAHRCKGKIKRQWKNYYKPIK